MTHISSIIKAAPSCAENLMDASAKNAAHYHRSPANRSEALYGATLI